MGHYEFGEHADVYTQLMFNDYESVAQIAPSGNFFDTGTINCDNPFLPVNSLATIGCGPAASRGRHRRADVHRPAQRGRRRAPAVVREQLVPRGGGRAWRDQRRLGLRRLGAVLERRRSMPTRSTTSSINRLQRALDVVDVGGVPTCQSVIDGTDPNCVPWNPFQPGGITPAQLNYLQATGMQTGRINQEIYNAVVNGDLGVYGIKSPLATDGIQVVFGTEWRRDTIENTVDSLQTQGQLAGSGGPTIGISGGTKVEELFFEARVPIAQDRAGMESLSFDTAYRYSDYGDSVQTDTYKFGLEWAPVQDVRLRGSYQKAVRAANIVELFTAQGFNLFDMDGDPCGAASRDPEASDAECIASGVPAGQVGANSLDSPAGQYKFLQGGNNGLTPEESDTYSYGSRVHAAVRTGSCDHGRLLRHPDRRHDLDLRRRELAQRLLRQQRRGRLRPHQPQPERPTVGRQRQHGGPQHQHRLGRRPRDGTSTLRTRVWRWAASAA